MDLSQRIVAKMRAASMSNGINRAPCVLFPVRTCFGDIRPIFRSWMYKNFSQGDG